MKRMTKTELLRYAHNDPDWKNVPHHVLGVDVKEQSMTVRITSRYNLHHPNRAKRMRRVVSNITYSLR